MNDISFKKVCWWLLRVAYTVVPIGYGIYDIICSYSCAPMYRGVLFNIGIIEIAAGLLIGLMPRPGGIIFFLWSSGVIVSCIYAIIISLTETNPHYPGILWICYDIVRYTLIAVGALSLAWLTKEIKKS